jgi:hypothetical protein
MFMAGLLRDIFSPIQIDDLELYNLGLHPDRSPDSVLGINTRNLTSLRGNVQARTGGVIDEDEHFIMMKKAATPNFANHIQEIQDDMMNRLKVTKK